MILYEIILYLIYFNGIKIKKKMPKKKSKFNNNNNKNIKRKPADVIIIIIIIINIILLSAYNIPTYVYHHVLAVRPKLPRLRASLLRPRLHNQGRFPRSKLESALSCAEVAHLRILYIMTVTIYVAQNINNNIL